MNTTKNNNNNEGDPGYEEKHDKVSGNKDENNDFLFRGYSVNIYGTCQGESRTSRAPAGSDAVSFTFLASDVLSK